MKTLFLDIETIPADLSDAALSENLKILYDKKCAKIGPEEEKISFEQFVDSTSFDGGFGRILCIALAVNSDEVKCYCSDDKGVWDEKKMLENFWKVAGQCDLFVGHNIFDFDMRFIYQRSTVLGIKPSKDISFARYRSSPMFDTMHEWSKWSWSGKIGLEHIALALGIPSPKDGIDGSQVAEFFRKGETQKICEYCKRDVETTRSVYKKLTFAQA